MNIQLLLFLPLLFALTLLFFPLKVRNLLSHLYVLGLGTLSLVVFFDTSDLSVNFPHTMHTFFTVIDFALIGYFIFEGIKYKHTLVTSLATVQLILLISLLFFEPSLSSKDIVVDRVSSMMLLVVNIVGGIIILYTLKYVESESFSRYKKNLFPCF